MNEERLQADFLTRVANTLGVDHNDILKLLCQKPPLRDVEEFSVMEHVYLKTSRPTKPLPSSSVKEWDRYLAKMDVLNPPLFILDTDGFVKPVRKNFSVEALDTLDVLDTLTSVPKKVKDRIFTAATHEGTVFEDEDSMEDRADALARAYLFYRAVPQLNDPSFLRKIDLPQLVQEIVSFRVDKDPALRAAHEAHLLRGLSPKSTPTASNLRTVAQVRACSTK